MKIGAVVWMSPPDADVSLQALLGASVAMRSAAVALSLPAELRVVFSAPLSAHAALLEEADRFGLTEVEPPVEAASPAEAMGAAAARMDDVDVLLLLAANQPIITASVARALVDACVPGVSAAGAWPVDGPVFRGGDGLQDQVDGPLWQLSLPVAATRVDWLKLPAGWTAHAAAALLEAGTKVLPVALDADARPLGSAADVGRAVEAFGRRAPQLPLLWPRVPGTPTGAVTSPPPAATPNITLVDVPRPG